MTTRLPRRRPGPAITTTAQRVVFDVFDARIGTIEAPAVATRQTPLAPSVTVVGDEQAAAADASESGAIRVFAPRLAPLVDIVTGRLADTLVTIRSRPVTMTCVARAADAVLRADTSGSAVTLTSRVVRGETSRVEVLHRQPTPPGAFGEATLRAWLLALFKASGAASPQDLSLVGIYERVPGGAVASVSLVADGLAIRTAAKRAPRPATLVVGRSRTHQGLVTAEV